MPDWGSQPCGYRMVKKFSRRQPSCCGWPNLIYLGCGGSRFCLNPSRIRQKHPKVYFWTQVKELIPRVTATGKGARAESSDEEKSSDGDNTAVVLEGDGAGSLAEEKSSSEGKDAAVIGSILRSLGTATEQFRKNGFVLNDTARERMRKTIQQLLEVVSDRIRVRFTIEDFPGD